MYLHKVSCNYVRFMDILCMYIICYIIKYMMYIMYVWCTMHKVLSTYSSKVDGCTLFVSKFFTLCLNYVTLTLKCSQCGWCMSVWHHPTSWPLFTSWHICVSWNQLHITFTLCSIATLCLFLGSCVFQASYKRGVM